jgi:NTP pyrophosphatase (non-canonical NTP hydrolase)
MSVRLTNNGLDARDVEVIGILMEELAESTQIAGKILRHGYWSSNPLIENAKNNKELLAEELGHVLNAIRMLVDDQHLDEQLILDSAEAKYRSIQKWLHHKRSHDNNDKGNSSEPPSSSRVQHKGRTVPKA